MTPSSSGVILSMYPCGAEITSKRVDFEIINLSKRVWSGIRSHWGEEFETLMWASLVHSKGISQGYPNLFYIARRLKSLEGIGNINKANTIY